MKAPSPFWIAVTCLVGGFLSFCSLSAEAGSFPVTYADVTATNLPPGALGTSSMDARPADLDGDGDLDLVVASEFRTNFILINDGTGRFTNESAARIPQPLRDSEDIGIGDFDLDGDLDIIFVSEDDQTNELYLNDGQGFFSDASDRLPTTGVSNAVLVAFVDADESPDIIIGNAGQNVVLINDGTGHFVDETSSRLPGNTNVTQDLEWGDIDLDGDMDLVEGNEDGNRLLLNNGSGVFVDVTPGRLPIPDAGEETREADLGDVDGDGDLDLFLANVTFGVGAPAQNRLLLNDGNGFFTDVTATHLPVNLEYTVDGDFVDLNYDGHLDLITAQAFVGTYQILLNDGDGHFTDRTTDLFETLPTGTGIDIEAADFDGDGLLELYLTGYQQSDYLYSAHLEPASTPDPASDSGDAQSSPRSLLEPSFPNPFRSLTTVRFTLSQAEFVTLSVMDASGGRIAELENRHLAAGSHVYQWEASGLAAGHYYWRLETPVGALSQGLVLLR